MNTFEKILEKCPDEIRNVIVRSWGSQICRYIENRRSRYCLEALSWQYSTVEDICKRFKIRQSNLVEIVNASKELEITDFVRNVFALEIDSESCMGAKIVMIVDC